MPDVMPPQAPSSNKARLFPAWVYLAGSILIGFAPLILLWLGGAEAIEDFFFALYRRLGLIQPFSLIPLYFDAVLKCDYEQQLDFTNCSAIRFIFPQRYVGGLLETAGTVIAASDAAGIAVLLLALLIGYFVALGLVKAVFRVKETGVLTMAASGLLTPFVASIIALILQGVSMLLSLLIAYVIAALLWAAASLRGGWELYKKVLETKETAERLKEMHIRYGGLSEGETPLPAPQPPPPPAAPG